jgi:hypothetical protein
MKIISLAILILMVALSACSPAAPQIAEPTTAAPIATPPPAVEVEEPEPVPYPYPGPPTPFFYTHPYPMEEQVVQYPDVPFITPAPSSGKGVLVGHVVDRETGENLAYQTVYLGYKIFFTDGNYSLAVQENSSPKTMADKEGRFAIGDIEPGEYVISIWTPMDASFVMDPATDKEMEIVIEAGEILDIGTILAVDPLK